MKPKYLRFLLMGLLIFASCSGYEPNRYQKEILDWLALPTNPVSNLSYDSSYYDLKRNEVQFYDIAITEGMSPAYLRTVREQFKNSERCRLLSKVLFASRFADVIPMFVRADANIRIIVMTDHGEVLEDEIFSPEEYSKTPSKDDVQSVVVSSLEQQAESLKLRLPARMEDGVTMVAVDFNKSVREFHYYIEIQDILLSQMTMGDLQAYADYLCEKWVALWYENIFDKDITEWYREANLSFVVFMTDQRGNVQCRSSKKL